MDWDAVSPLGALPGDLLHSIVDRLPLLSLTDLRATSRSLGLPATHGSLISLHVPLAEVDLHKQPSRGERIAQLSGLAALSLVSVSSAGSSEPCSTDHDCQQQQARWLMAHVAPSITSLTLSGVSAEVIQAVADSCAAGRCPALTHLTLHHLVLNVLTEAPHPADRIATLAHVRCLRSFDVDSSFVDCSLSKLTQLQSLSLTGRWRCNLAELSLTNLCGLTKLSVDMTEFNRVGGLASLTNLQSLALRGRRLRNEAFMAAVMSLRQLTRLSIAWIVYLNVCGRLCEQHVTKLVHIEVLSMDVHASTLVALTHLTHLACGILYSPQLGPVAVCVPHLLLLDAWSIRRVPVDLNLPQPMCVTFPVLQILALRNACLIDGRGDEDRLWFESLFPLGEEHAMRALHSFHCMGNQLTAELAATFRALTSLTLLAPLLSASQLAAVQLLGSRCKVLELHAPGHAAFVACISACRCLSTLIVRPARDSGYFMTVSDASFVAMASSHCLHDVLLVEVAQLTAVGVAAVAANPAVKRIQVVHCPQVSRSDARRVYLAAGRPDLDIVVKECKPGPL